MLQNQAHTCHYVFRDGVGNGRWQIGDQIERYVELIAQSVLRFERVGIERGQVVMYSPFEQGSTQGAKVQQQLSQ